jgi:hypothetical protein
MINKRRKKMDKGITRTLRESFIFILCGSLLLCHSGTFALEQAEDNSPEPSSENTEPLVQDSTADVTSDPKVPEQESDVKVPEQESDAKVPEQESDAKVPEQDTMDVTVESKPETVWVAPEKSKWDVPQYSGRKRAPHKGLTCGQIEGKILGFKKLRNAGYGLMGGGAVLTVLGIAMISSADGETSYETSTTGGETGDPAGAFGALLVSTGIGSFIAGIILASTGSKKVKQYKSFAGERNCSLSFTLQPRKLALNLHF